MPLSEQERKTVIHSSKRLPVVSVSWKRELNQEMSIAPGAVIWSTNLIQQLKLELPLD